MSKKGFTLVELLAVIVILATILIIAVPQILHIINTARINSIKNSAILIATNAEKDYLFQQTLNQNYSAESIECEKTTKLDNNYLSCSIIYDDTGVAIVKLVGKNMFNKITCYGTKDAMNCEQTELKYTIRRSLNSKSTVWQRLDGNIGKVANATKNGINVKNDFDNIYPWSDIITYNYNTATNEITAYYGDDNFRFDGTNGEVLTKIPEFYYKREQKDGYEYVSISPYELEGYSYSPEFSVARYVSSYSEGKLHSKSNTFPDISRTITSARTLSKNVGLNFGQMDYHYFLIQLLYLVEYADYNSQDILGKGAVSFRRNDADKAVIGENNTNRIVINKSGANLFIVGQYVHIGTGLNNNSKGAFRLITAIEDYDSTNKSIIFDGIPINIAQNNRIYSAGIPNGLCDSLGMKSGTLNDDGKHCVIYRGIENIHGNVQMFIDGINIKNRVAYINTNPNTYEVDKYNGDYNAVGYTNSSTTAYANVLGYDPNNPLISFPISSSNANGNTGISDYYYQNSGNYMALVGGHMANENWAGMWYWAVDSASSKTDVRWTSRLIKY